MAEASVTGRAPLVWSAARGDGYRQAVPEGESSAVASVAVENGGPLYRAWMEVDGVKVRFGRLPSQRAAMKACALVWEHAEVRR